MYSGQGDCKKKKTFGAANSGFMIDNSAPPTAGSWISGNKSQKEREARQTKAPAEFNSREKREDTGIIRDEEVARRKRTCVAMWSP